MAARPVLLGAKLHLPFASRRKSWAQQHGPARTLTECPRWLTVCCRRMLVATLGLTQLELIPVIHCRDSWGVLLRARDWSLAYSGDTRPCQVGNLG